jgi:hypothetical protein
MSGEVADPAPQRRLLTSKREYLEGLDHLLQLATRELRIFDPDLSQLGLHAPDRAAVLRAFLQGHPTHTIDVVVRDPDFLTRHSPRLMALLSSFPQGIRVRQSGGEALKAQDCFVLADDSHLVRRPVAEQPRGVIILNDAKDCRSIYERFGEIWEDSPIPITPGVSGL